MGENSVLTYLKENLDPDIKRALIHEDMPLDMQILEEVVNELNAKNMDAHDSLEKNPAAQAAIMLQNPEMKKALNTAKEMGESLAKNRGDDPAKGGEEGVNLLKNVMVDLFSKDYSKNVTLESHLAVFETPSIKSIKFSSAKESEYIRKFARKQGYNQQHQYVIKRDRDFTIDLLFKDDDFNRNTKSEPYLSIVMENKELPYYTPSKIITKNIHLTEEKWPYPKNDEHWNRIEEHEIKKHFKSIGWYSIDLREGEFRKNTWKLFCEIMEDHTFMQQAIVISEAYMKAVHSGSKPFEIVEGFESPTGEITLAVGTNLRIDSPHSSTDVLLDYRNSENPREQASLYIRSVNFNPERNERYNIQPGAF